MKKSVCVGLRSCSRRASGLGHPVGGRRRVVQSFDRRVLGVEGSRAPRRERVERVNEGVTEGSATGASRLHQAARIALSVYCHGDRALEDAVALILMSSGGSARALAREAGVDRVTLVRKARKFGELLAEAWRREKMDPRVMVCDGGT